jgi:DNA-binding CsgD family transcriptional regulator
MSDTQQARTANLGPEIEPNLVASIAAAAELSNTTDLTPEEPPTTTYEERLYSSLGRIADQRIPDDAIKIALDHFPRWSFRRHTTLRNQAVCLLERPGINPLLALRPPAPPTPRRIVHKDRTKLTIVIPEVQGSDMRYLIDIERQLQEKPEPTLDEATKALFEQAQVKYRQAGDKFLSEDDIFTDTETALIELTAHCGSSVELARAIGISKSTTYRKLVPVYERLGIDSYVDLTLIARALGMVQLDHIPSGKTEKLAEKDKKLFEAWYSLDPKEQTAARNIPQSTAGPRWSRLFSEMGVNGRHMAVLCALKDELIQPPARVDIYTAVATRRKAASEQAA